MLKRGVMLACMLLAMPAWGDEAQARLDGLLQTMGGADVWARVVGARVTATHYTTQLTIPHRNVIWNDFLEFRVRIEAMNKDLVRVRYMTADKGWRYDGKAVIDLTPQQIADERRWWTSNVYRTLHRLARRDKGLTVKMLDKDRLAVFGEDGQRLCWLRLSPGNEPIQFGSGPGDEGTVFGPLAAHASGARYPRWGASADGTWRYEVHDIEFVTTALVIPDQPPR